MATAADLAGYTRNSHCSSTRRSSSWSRPRSPHGCPSATTAPGPSSAIPAGWSACGVPGPGTRCGTSTGEPRRAAQGLLVREHEPTASLRVAVFVDLDAARNAPPSAPPDLVEFVVAVAASVVADLAGRGVAVGLYSAATVHGREIAHAPSSAPSALPEALELLGQGLPLRPSVLRRRPHPRRRDNSRAPPASWSSPRRSRHRPSSPSTSSAAGRRSRRSGRRRRRRRPLHPTALATSVLPPNTPTTGTTVRPWNWLHNVAVPVALAVVEATWASLCLSAIVNGSGRFHVDLPYLAFALPAATAACLVGLSGRLSWRWWQRDITVAPLVVLGAAAPAGLVDEHLGTRLVHGGHAAAPGPWSDGFPPRPRPSPGSSPR